MQDYTNLGLNAQLQPAGSPVTQRMQNVTAKEFDEKYELPYGGITTSNLVSTARSYTAVVSLSGEKGTFKDIQLAINFVNTLGGGTVFIKSGTYTLSSNITLYSNISLIGESNVSTVIDCNEASRRLILSSCSNVLIENIKLTKSRSFSGVITLTSSTYVTIMNCTFENNSGGIGNYVDIYIDSGTHTLLVQNCTSTEAGIFIYTNSADTRNSFLYNKVIDAYGSVFGNGVSGNVQGNYCLDFIGSAITGAIVNARVIGNHFESSVNTGDIIDCVAGSLSTLSNNYLVSTSGTDNGIRLRSTSTGITMLGNAISITGGGSNVEFSASVDTNNVLVGNVLFGSVLDNGSANIVANNA